MQQQLGFHVGVCTNACRLLSITPTTARAAGRAIEGVDVGSPLAFLYGYLQTALACLLIAMLLYRCASALPSYGSRIGVVLLAGLGGTVLVTLGGPIWWHQPWRFHVIHLVYAAVAWLLAGFVLGGLIKKGRLRF